MPDFPSTPPSDEQLEHYLAGTLSGPETALVRQWLEAQPRVHALQELLGAMSVNAPRAEWDEADAHRAWEDLQERFAQENPGNARSEKRRTASTDFGSTPAEAQGRLGRSLLGRKTLYVVSSLAMTGMAVLLSRGALNGARTTLSTHTYATTAGQHATVTLTDGSRVQLGPLTTLAVTTDPARSRVDARVSGEALFTVTHRSNVSFQVRTANAVTRVLGTTFLVRRYPTDRATQVVVTEGRVSLADARRRIDDSEHILTAHGLGTVDDSGTVLVKPNIAVDDYVAWTTGRLVFHDVPARDVVAELGRVYDVELRITDPTLAALRVNWMVSSAQRSLTGVLEALSDILDAHPVRTGRIITLVPGRSTSHRSPDLPSSTPERQYGR